MCWKIIAIITENARNNTHKNNIGKFHLIFGAYKNSFNLDIAPGENIITYLNDHLRNI
jgi:hypothetical protein